MPAPVSALMQEAPLTLDHLLRRAGAVSAGQHVVGVDATGVRVRTTYATVADRARRLAGALADLGVAPGGRVATFAANSIPHLELYLGVPSAGRVLHPLNIRFHDEQTLFVARQAEDEIVAVDRSLLPQFWPLVDQLPSLRHVVVLDDGAGDVPDDPRIVHYEQLLSSTRPGETPVVLDENSAASMCHTSGTTGQPRGVVYSHRSLMLHALAMTGADALAVSRRDTVLPVVPMFHVNAWSLPYAAVAAGAALILPGADVSGAAIADLVESERVTLTAAVPTVWRDALPHLIERDTSSLRTIACGGSAVPSQLAQDYRDRLDVPIRQAWGMTETSSICTLAAESDADAGLAGAPLPGVEIRIVDRTTGAEQDWDGRALGELQIRGPWIARAYHRSDDSPVSADGWLHTGDVARIWPGGHIELVDRMKDLVKSGGEWISSVQLENEIMAHPDVIEAAVIGIPSDRWMERPLACVVLAPDADADGEAIIDFLRPRVARWWLPEAIEFVSSIPRTSVGKYAKRELRSQFDGYRLP